MTIKLSVIISIVVLVKLIVVRIRHCSLQYVSNHRQLCKTSPHSRLKLLVILGFSVNTTELAAPTRVLTHMKLALAVNLEIKFPPKLD